jgi:phage terminase large subunit
VINVFALTADGTMYHVHEEYQRQRGIDEWARIARQLRDLWKIEAFYCDPSEPDYIRKLTEAGCKAVEANNTVSTGIQTVKRRLTTKRLLHYRGAVNTFAEYESYQWAKRSDTVLDQPQKANDHSLDALRYAVMGVDYAVSRQVTADVRRWA